MVYAPDSGRSRGYFARSFKLGLLPDATGGDADPVAPRDLKKLVLIIGLGTLSWVATYVGMLELIEANMGDLPLIHKVIIGFSVAMLMTMIVWLLDQMFAPVGTMTRLAYIAGYLFLSIISVGFGFGFYWKVLESRAESSRSAESAVTAVQSSLNAASTRLEQLNATLVQLATVSRAKAETERAKGTSCPNSKPGDGPRRRMRDEDAARFSFASEFVAGRVAAVKTDMAALDGDLARIAANDPAIIDPKSGTRNEFMKSLSRKLDMTVSGFNALRTDPQLKQMRQDLAERADKSTFGDPKNGGFVCPDTELAQALRGAARAINELPVLEKPTIAAVEGSEATIEAFRRLTTTFYGLLSFKLPPSADELRELQKKAMQSVEAGPAATVVTEEGGLSKRDYVPLAVAIFVDICLFLVSIGRPAHRLHGLMPKMREAERGPVIEILSRFNDIHRDPEIRESFELFRHVVFDLHGAYYVAVPLDAPPHVGAAEREELRTEAQLLSNLFTSFEKDKIFRRTWTPFAGVVRKKLAKQGSKFAGSEAFRVYRFRDGAWSEIILGAVMGAARRVEAEAQRRRIERDLLRPMEPRFAQNFGKEQRPEFGSGFGPAMPHRADAEPAFAPQPAETAVPPAVEPAAPTRAESWTAAWTPARPAPPKAKPATPRVSTSDDFGPYARSAKAELSAEPEAFDDEPLAEPANSNTVPSHQPDIVEARRAAAPEAPRPRVDVVLKRETATLTLPLDAADGPGGLIGRLGQALEGIEQDNEKIPAPRQISATEVNAHQSTGVAPEVAANRTDELSESFEALDVIDESDPSADDVVAIAGRLRPAIANT
ncbi:hypothetical protein [Hyphomicrobium zavarzinii]|uniref:hypothetical protein n=1 Tax=Hyphomicrobium zavarzinii TaxID=48292 RepID=UPI00039DC98D|nr:hypothetical protein [Hyphomicrobium zavarzinii]